MLVEPCRHEWKLNTESSLNMGAGVIPAYFRCQKCRTLMTAPEVFQLEALENQNETLRHLKGFQKYIAILAVIISITALVVSIFRP